MDDYIWYTVPKAADSAHSLIHLWSMRERTHNTINESLHVFESLAGRCVVVRERVE